MLCLRIETFLPLDIWDRAHHLQSPGKQARIEQSSDHNQAAPEKWVKDEALGQGIGEVVNYRIEERRIEGNRQNNPFEERVDYV